jgi:hypothetical protein
MHGEAFHKLGVQDIIKFDSGWCSISTWWRKEKRRRKKRNCHGEGGFPQGWTCLAGSVPRVAAVRCN